MRKRERERFIKHDIYGFGLGKWDVTNPSKLTNTNKTQGGGGGDGP